MTPFEVFKDLEAKKKAYDDFKNTGKTDEERFAQDVEEKKLLRAYVNADEKYRLLIEGEIE